MQYLYGEEPILIRTMGGSIPIAPIIDALDVPAATVPTVNMDNNQHSPNENLRLGILAGSTVDLRIPSSMEATEATLAELDMALQDVYFAPNKTVPTGLHIQDIRIRIPEATRGRIVGRSTDTVERARERPGEIQDQFL